MKSSMDAFEEAVHAITRLNNWYMDGTAGLSRVWSAAEEIGLTLSKSNESLGSGWLNVADTLNNVDNSLSAMLREIIDDMKAFIQETKSNENNMTAAVTNARTLSEELLNELNLG